MAADSAVMVIDGAKGVEPQTRKLFKVCALRHIPIFTFVALPLVISNSLFANSFTLPSVCVSGISRSSPMLNIFTSISIS